MRGQTSAVWAGDCIHLGPALFALLCVSVCLLTVLAAVSQCAFGNTWMLNGYLSPPLGDKWPPVQGSHRLSLKGGSAIIQGIHTHAHVCTITFHIEVLQRSEPPHIDLKVDFLHLVFPTSKKAAAARKRPWVTCNSISLNSLSERIVWGSFRRRQISTLLTLFGILSFFFFFFVWMICWAISSDYETRHKMMLKTCAG